MLRAADRPSYCIIRSYDDAAFIRDCDTLNFCLLNFNVPELRGQRYSIRGRDQYLTIVALLFVAVSEEEFHRLITVI